MRHSTFPNRKLLVRVTCGCLLALIACQPARSPAEGGAEWRGPIVLISLASMRADAIGGFGARGNPTPALDSLVDQADWAGPALATSTFGPASLASAMTGLPPWRHGVTDPGGPALRRDVTTLAERLASAGATTRAFVADRWLSSDFGFEQGFSVLASTRRDFAAMAWLRNLEDQFSLTWIHLATPRIPYIAESAREGGRNADRLRRLDFLLDVKDVAPYLDPALSPSPTMRRKMLRYYRSNVEQADREISRILGVLRRANQFDDSLVIIFGDNGEALGEAGHVLHGFDLSEEALRVPLIIKLPKNLGVDMKLPATAHPSTARITATVLKVLALDVPAFLAPPLQQGDQQPALVAHLFDNGEHHLALIQDEVSVELDCVFLSPQEEVWKARIESILGAQDAAWEQIRRKESEAWSSGGDCSSTTRSIGSSGNDQTDLLDSLRERAIFLADDMSAPNHRRTSQPRRISASEAEELRARGFPVRPSWF